MDTENLTEVTPEQGNAFVGAALLVSAGYTAYRAARGLTILARRGYHRFQESRETPPETES